MSRLPADQKPWTDFTETLRTGSLLVSHRFDPSRLKPSLALFEALSQVESFDVMELPPLYDFGVDLDALDALAVDEDDGLDTPTDAGEIISLDSIPVGGVELPTAYSDGSGDASLGVLIRLGRYLLCCDPMSGAVDVYDSPNPVV